jgi:L,D-transpeptidase catalytic domain
MRFALQVYVVASDCGCHMRVGSVGVGSVRLGRLGNWSWRFGALIGATLTMSLGTTAQAAISIQIDKNAQRMTVAVDGQTRYVWPVSTGRPGYDTPNGTFKVNRMDANHQSQEWDGAPMPHTMFFDLRGHAIHGFSDVKHLGLPVSHGCVRLAPPNAAALFALVNAQGMGQTTVVVSGQTPARGGEEMARRRAPAQPVAVQPQQAPPQGYSPPGYDYQPAPPQPYPAQAYGQQQQYYREAQPGYAPPAPGYYRQAPPGYYGQQQPYYAQQPPGYFPPQPPPVYVRPPGLY